MKFGSLVWGLARYLEHHVFAEISLSPAPSNSKEVQHLLENFRRLGHVEYFRVSRNHGSNGSLSTYGTKLWLVYNPSDHSTLLKSRLFPSNILLPANFLQSDQVAEKQSDLVRRLSSLIALPRYSYIEGDHEYLDGTTEIRFSHKLTREGLKYDNRYSVSPSRAANQFVTIQFKQEAEPFDISDLRKNLRHNFQKFHKFDSVSVSTGPDSLRQWMNSKDYRVTAPKVHMARFKGFYD